MKQKLLLGLISTSAAMLLVGCGEDFRTSGTTSGCIAPVVSLDTEVLSTMTQGRAATDITVSDLSLTLTSADGSFSKKWASVDEFPTDEQFKVGEYTFEASYGDNTEGFDKPYYAGSTTLIVKENATTPVSLTAALANAMVSIDYTDTFKSYFKSYNTELSTSAGGFIFFAPGETRPGYLHPGSVGMTVSVTKPNGVQASFNPSGFVAEARHHYHLTLDVNEGNAGASSIVITFDDSLNHEDVIIDLSDDLSNAPAPAVTTEGFTPGETLTFVSGMSTATSCKLSIVARGGLSSIIMTTASTSLIEKGWPAEIDLLATPANMQARLSALGFEGMGLWKNPDQMAIIDLTKVLNNITYIEGNSNETRFTFVIKDLYTKEAEPVELNVTIEKLTLEISEPTMIYEGEDNVQFNLAYNGTDVENNVKFQYKNERGTWSDTEATNIAPVARSAGNYTVTLNVPANDAQLTLRAVCGNSTSESLTVDRTPLPFDLTYSDNDVFATHALVSMVAREGASTALAARATLYVSYDGTNYTNANATIAADGSCNLTGLKPATRHYLKIGAGGAPIEFTTEADAQLPNSDMEQWTSIARKSNCVEWFAEGWNTLNPLTISQYSASGNYSYCATSGTKETSDAATGSKAALIRTVGWGSGNTAAGGGSFMGSKVKHIDRGELSLGQWGSEINDGILPEYGIVFTSRPESISFQYKYIKVGDYNGYAEITVYASDGSVLATKSTEITPQGSYTLMTLPLEYAAGAPKASKISAIFRSSNVTGSLGEKKINTTNNNLNYGSVSASAEHVGSQLYIDDIQLNY